MKLKQQITIMTQQDKEQLINESIDSVLDKFDFIKVHSIMKFLNWEYRVDQYKKSIPSLSKIVRTAEYVLRQVTKHYGEEGYFFCTTGGFKATLYKGELSLIFEVESASFIYG